MTRTDWRYCGGPADSIEGTGDVRPESLRVLLASPVRFYADGLARELAQVPGLEVVGVVRSVDDVAAQSTVVEPDVVLLDVLLLPRGVADAGPPLLSLRPSVRVVALAVADHDQDVLDWAELGIDGLVTRNSSLADVAAAVRGACRGELHCSPRVAATLLRRVGVLAAQAQSADPGPVDELTARELEILELVDAGLSNKEISQRTSRSRSRR